MSAAAHEPPPHAGQVDIADLVLKDIQERVDAGLQKYGTKLQSFNGRSALWDAYQEAIDLVMYLRQAIAEHEAAAIAEHPDFQCGSCGDKITWIDGAYRHEDKEPRHAHLAWPTREWCKR